MAIYLREMGGRRNAYITALQYYTKMADEELYDEMFDGLFRLIVDYVPLTLRFNEELLGVPKVPKVIHALIPIEEEKEEPPKKKQRVCVC